MNYNDIELPNCPVCQGTGLIEEENGWCVYVTCLDCGSRTAEVSFKTEEEKMEAAKKVGHYGATVMQAKGVSKIQRKFLGFSIDPETTIVLMIVKDEIVLDVIKKIYSVVDFKSEARGMVFALPISLVAGLNETYEKIDIE